MPVKKGTKRGPYKTKRRMAAEMVEDLWNQKSGETEAQIEARINERFDILNALVAESISGLVRAMIVSGPAGLGKSHTVETCLEAHDPSYSVWTHIKGYVKPTGLYKTLYKYRHPGNIIVFDDADSIFNDENALNMLKAVCDTNEKRRVSYLSEGALYDDETEERLPKQFEFEGAIVFISNLDFDGEIDRGNKLSPHLSAMMSRSHYIDLAMKTKEDYLVRIKSMIRKGLLANKNMSKAEETDVLSFINENSDSLRELSLRIALKIADIRKSGRKNWKSFAKVTCCRS